MRPDVESMISVGINCSEMRVPQGIAKCESFGLCDAFTFRFKELDSNWNKNALQ